MPFQAGNYEHGTMQRFRQHVYAGEKLDQIDDACKAARNAHEREYQTRPEVRAKMTRHQKIRRRALGALTEEKHERYLVLVADERTRTAAVPAWKDDEKTYKALSQKIRRRAAATLAEQFPERYQELYREAEIALMWEEVHAESLLERRDG